MTGFRIEIDTDALVRDSWRHMAWWQRVAGRIIGKERVITRAVAEMAADSTATCEKRPT